VRGRRRVFWEVLGRARVAPAGDARPLALAAGALSIVLLAGCGGGSRQDAGEKEATYHVKVLAASFPAKQSIAKPARMVLRVRNTGSTAVPNLAITVDSFNYASNYPELAANRRPIWVIEQGPGAVAKPPVESQEVSPPAGGQTAYVNTWALGPLPAGKTQTFTWKVMPVKAGAHVVKYTVAAGLTGKARALLASGGPASGSFTTDVAAAPPASYVDPKTGKVLAGVYPGNTAAGLAAP
jgi:hypothetical protein